MIKICSASLNLLEVLWDLLVIFQKWMNSLICFSELMSGTPILQQIILKIFCSLELKNILNESVRIIITTVKHFCSTYTPFQSNHWIVFFPNTSKRSHLDALRLYKVLSTLFWRHAPTKINYVSRTSGFLRLPCQFFFFFFGAK